MLRLKSSPDFERHLPLENTPDILYYNCLHASTVLATGKITWQKGLIRTGVSMSEWEDLGSHGPFKIAFRRAPWFAQFQKVIYGNGPNEKNPMFEDEREWYSNLPVVFDVSRDVIYVGLMTNAPGHTLMGPRKMQGQIKDLRQRWSQLYREMQVNDPYLTRTY